MKIPAIKGRFSLLKPLLFSLAALLVFEVVILPCAKILPGKDEAIPTEYGAKEIEKLSREIEKDSSDIKSILERGRIRCFMGIYYWIDANWELEEKISSLNKK